MDKKGLRKEVNRLREQSFNRGKIIAQLESQIEKLKEKNKYLSNIVEAIKQPNKIIRLPRIDYELIGHDGEEFIFEKRGKNGDKAT